MTSRWSSGAHAGEHAPLEDELFEVDGLGGTRNESLHDVERQEIVRGEVEGRVRGAVSTRIAPW